MATLRTVTLYESDFDSLSDGSSLFDQLIRLFIPAYDQIKEQRPELTVNELDLKRWHYGATGDAEVIEFSAWNEQGVPIRDTLKHEQYRIDHPKEVK